MEAGFSLGLLDSIDDHVWSGSPAMNQPKRLTDKCELPAYVIMDGSILT